MKILFLIAVTVTTTMAFASGSKVICGHKTFDGSSISQDVIYDKDAKALGDINEKIKAAEAEGYTKVSAPMGVTINGYTQSFCVTVTKP